MRTITITILIIFFLATFSISKEHAIAQSVLGLVSEEAEAAYHVLEAINADVRWRDLYSDNLCLDGPHGLVCEPDDANALHVVEINIGWVSDADDNPICTSQSTISPSIAHFPFLRKLFFYNCFTEVAMTLPSVLWSLPPSFTELVFQRNSALMGSVPQNISALSNLQRLVLTGNGLSGSIPSEIGRLKFLKQLVLSHNHFTGNIPAELSALSEIRILDLSFNELTEEIPVSLMQKMPYLYKLDLSHNRLNGSMPQSISSATSLNLVDLSFNRLTTTAHELQCVLQNLSNLRVLQLSYNPLNTELPLSVWRNLSRVVGIGMASSGLRGKIPQSIGALHSLRYLDLMGNRLQGAIPFSLAELPRIYEIDLRSNSLVGVLPFSTDFLIRLGRNLRVSGNQGLCCSPSDHSVVVASIDGRDVRPCSYSDADHRQYNIKP